MWLITVMTNAPLESISFGHKGFIDLSIMFFEFSTRIKLFFLGVFYVVIVNN